MKEIKRKNNAYIKDEEDVKVANGDDKFQLAKQSKMIYQEEESVTKVKGRVDLKSVY